MNLCGETLREINMFMEYFFSSELENTFYSEIEKENLVQFRWAEGTQTQNEIPLFITRSREMARFSYYNIIFHFHELENTFYSEIEKENLVQFRWAEGTQTQNEIPLFITRSREMARFSILQHNFPFSWSICMELSIFSETRLEIGQWMILFLQNSDVRTLYTQTKEV